MNVRHGLLFLGESMVVICAIFSWIGAIVWASSFVHDYPWVGGILLFIVFAVVMFFIGSVM